jgi:hypothetical protein
MNEINNRVIVMIKLSFGPIQATGSGAVVFVMGFILYYFNIAQNFGIVSMYIGSIITIIYLILGVISTIAEIIG